MAGSDLKKPNLRVAKVGAAFVAAYGLAWWLNWHRINGAKEWVHDAIYRIFAGFPTMVVFADQILDKLANASMASYWLALSLASFAAPIAFLVRMVARARVRAGHRDLLDGLRGWSATHPRSIQALTGFAPTLWAIVVYGQIAFWNGHGIVERAIPALLSGLAEYWLLDRGVRMFLSPTIDEGASSTMTISDDEIVFDAVAVTRETIGAIVAMGLFPIAFFTWVALTPIVHLFTDRSIFAVIAAYATVSLGGAALFRRASRAAVGIDGVRVYGTSRTRFFGYRDLDEARFNGGDLELVRKGRVLIRLQLHGEDAARRDAVLARIAAHIANARDPRTQGAQRFVEAKSTEEVARVAMGGGDYRAPSITRDALWQLVEGPTTDASSRTAAAQALVRAIPAGERPRLRVAAEKCADVRVRVALLQLASEIDSGEVDTAPVGVARAHKA